MTPIQLDKPISPSEWDLFNGEGACFRRGGFKYLAKLPDPGGEGARRGTRVHGRTEGYLQGEALDPDDLEDSMALALAKYLPAPGTAEDLAARGVVIEGNIDFVYQGVKYGGRKDLEWWIDYRARQGLVVTDYKTTSDFKYRLTETTLPQNVQAIMYPYHSLLRHPDQQKVRLEWLYVLSRKHPPTKPTTVERSRDQIEMGMAAVHEQSKLILEVREAGLAAVNILDYVNTLPYDKTLRQCEKYGKEGCPFRRECAAHGSVSATQLVKNSFRARLGGKGDTNMGMSVGRLKMQIKAKELGISYEGLSDADLTAAIAAKSGAPVASAPAVAQPAQQAPAAQPETPAPAKFTPPTGRILSAPPPSAGHPAGINPTPPPAQAEASPDQATEAPKAAEPAPAAPVAAEKAPDQEKPKAARGPRSKAPKAEETVTNVVNVAPVTSPETVARAVEAAIKERRPSDAVGLRLLINTLPKRIGAGPAPVTLSDLLRPVHAAIAEARNVPHYAMIPYEGRGVFAAALEQYLTENAGLLAGDTILVDARTPEGADALPVLERHASDIFQGV